jgi:hypothetical protein
MGYLKIALYWLLAFIERHPMFCLIMLLLAIFTPFVFKWIGWVLLGFLCLALIGILVVALRFRKMKRQMEEQMRNAGGGSPFGTGGGSPFGDMGATGGMTLEEFVRRMQEEADARQRQGGPKPQNDNKKSDVDSTEYVEFEEVE